MTGALEVHLVGGESGALHVLLTVIGPVLISGAAVFAARTARDSAAERQQKQLAHDSKRQEEALAHDREMRGEELAHDRQVRKKERARDVLDSALEKLHDARMKTNELSAEILGRRKVRADCEQRLQAASNALERTTVEKELADEQALLSALSKEAQSARRALNADWIRMLLRFGPSNPVTESYKAAMDTMGKVGDTFEEGIPRPLTDDEQKQAKELSAQIGSRLGEFTAACREWDDS